MVVIFGGHTPELRGTCGSGWGLLWAPQALLASVRPPVERWAVKCELQEAFPCSTG